MTIFRYFNRNNTIFGYMYRRKPSLTDIYKYNTKI
nr:MAG TPA: hypothetical protein [Caudoviricetes sp.]